MMHHRDRVIDSLRRVVHNMTGIGNWPRLSRCTASIRVVMDTKWARARLIDSNSFRNRYLFLSYSCNRYTRLFWVFRYKWRRWRFRSIYLCCCNDVSSISVHIWSHCCASINSKCKSKFLKYLTTIEKKFIRIMIEIHLFIFYKLC